MGIPNIVLESIIVLETYYFKTIYTKMKTWKMTDGVHDFKADKFTENETMYMVYSIKSISTQH
ncbi:MAG: hypothetical protein WBG71_12320 [Leeuwenhoekiella sp.]